MGLLSDIDSFESLSPQRQEFLVAYFVAIASLLSVIDGWLPKPLPLAKLGVANIVTLFLVMRSRYRLAMEVALLRVLVSHLFGGTLISFGFWLSLSGSLFSSVVMSVMHRLFQRQLSFYGVSLWGGWAHALAQGVTAALFLGMNRGIILYTVFLMSVGVVTSMVIAWIAEHYLQSETKVDKDHDNKQSDTAHDPKEKTSVG